MLGSGEQALFFEPVIEMSDELPVAVPFERRDPLVGAEHPLGGLAPARMGHLRIDVCPEAVFAALYGFPKGDRAFLGEGEMHDRLDRFEPVFPWQYQPQRGSVLLGNRL